MAFYPGTELNNDATNWCGPNPGERLVTVLFGRMGGLTLILTVVAFVVAQRRREMGIRLALGARRGHIYRSSLGQGD